MSCPDPTPDPEPAPALRRDVLETFAAPEPPADFAIRALARVLADAMADAKHPGDDAEGEDEVGPREPRA